MAKDAEWMTIDASTLSPAIAKAYAEYKEAYRMAKALREDFEKAMSDAAGLNGGKRLIFGYNFGKLSIAVVDDDRKPSKAKQSTLSLADFLARQEASGHRV